MNRSRSLSVRLVLGGLVAFQATHLFADDKQGSAAPEAFHRLLQCRAQTDAQQRLACYDSNVVALQQAQDRRELVIATREEIQEAKKELFGLSLPDMKLFSRGPDEDMTELEATVRSARQYAPGRWRFVLKSGGTWDQIDDSVLVRTPSNGDKFIIRRAAFGSFKAKVNNQAGIRVRRIQ